MCCFPRRYELAEYLFRRARSINPSSSVLSSYLSMALHAQTAAAGAQLTAAIADKSREALDILTEALQRDPRQPQVHTATTNYYD